MDQDTVTKFAADADALVKQLVEFAGTSDRSEQDNGLIRQLRVIVGALMSACDSAGRPVMRPMQPRQAQAQTPPAQAAHAPAPTPGRRS